MSVRAAGRKKTSDFLYLLSAGTSGPFPSWARYIYIKLINICFINPMEHNDIPTSIPVGNICTNLV